MIKPPPMETSQQSDSRQRWRRLLGAVGGLTLLGLALALVYTAYTNRHALLVSGHTEPQSVHARLAQMAVADPGVSSQAFLEFTRSLPLQSYQPNAEDLGIWVRERIPELTAYPCSSCHLQPLAELRAQSAIEVQLAHWEVQLNHAATAVMACATCHNLDTLDELRTLTGASVSFDASYQICAQCHSSQYQDWLGGAHGKRVGGWAEPRVIQACTDCHGPHAPAWEVRWPAVEPQQLPR